MPWKQDYTISDEGSLADAEIRWPEGARCCVAVTVDLSVASGAEGVTATDLATPEALFGANRASRLSTLPTPTVPVSAKL